MAQQNLAREIQKYLGLWMATRPYAKPSEYDLQYANLCRDVHQNELVKWGFYFENYKLQGADLIELSVIIVAYFEDFINEAGFWKAFVTQNQERFGYWLPFYDLSDYDPDYINAADINFLIWQWQMVKLGGAEMVSPIAQLLTDLGQLVLQRLDEMIEEMPATDAYDQFLNLEDNVDFFQFREKLVWLVRNCYLYGLLGFGPRIDGKFEETMEEVDIEGASPQEMASYEYDLHMGLLFSTVCPFGGVRSNEWAARIFNVAPALRTKIHAIQPRMRGDFILLSTEGSHYTFQHPATKREIEVSKKSMKIPGKRGDVFAMGLIKWGDEFWGQGVAVGKANRKVDDRGIFAGGLPELLMTAEEREKWFAFPKQMISKMVELFGGPFVIFPNRKAAEDANATLFAEMYNDKAGKYPAEANRILMESFDPHDAIAMYAIPDEGIGFCSNSPDVIDFLTHGTAHDLDGTQATYVLFDRINPVIVEWIFDHYDTASLGWEGMGLDVRKYWKFLSVYFFPEEAGEKKPQVTLVNA